MPLSRMMRAGRGTGEERGPSPASRSAPLLGRPSRCHRAELKVAAAEDLGVRAQVEREERVLQSPREAMSGAEEAGAKTGMVSLAPAAAGAGRVPPLCAVGRDVAQRCQ